ncbi:unnamed protein product [Phytomonas sp. EM1]|nr:unnamed protein product [Phytomonas sp. EM1]|eukprot:CCW60787.1 unnamed protein product [Phytomonas sp. isolate EM1]
MTKGKGRNPGVSGLNKHIRRKVHQERSQLAARRHLGELEKHKDHVLRGKKRKARVKRLLELKRAAAQRNPDEFQIGMTKAIMDVATGRMKKRKQRMQPEGRISELKQTIGHNTRNVQYLEFKAKADENRLRDLLEEDAATSIISTAPKNKHVVFVEDDDEFKHFDPLDYFDTTKEMLQRHPAIRGRLSVLQNIVLPEAILLSSGGTQTMKSVNQRRKERREIQQKLSTVGNDEKARIALLERIKAKQDVKRYYRFDDLLAEDLARRSDDRNGHMGLSGEDEVVEDDAMKLLKWRRQQEKNEAIDAARRAKEVEQRLERSKSLTALAKVIRRQNDGIQKQLTQKRDSRFKPTVPRRMR